MHAQAHGVEAALLQVGNVGIEFVEAHFLRRPNLFFEVRGLLANLWERVQCEGLVRHNRAILKSALPTVFEDPPLHLGIPMRAAGEDAATQLKGSRLKLENCEVGENVFVRVQKLIVEDACGLAQGVLLAANPLTIGP